jgi:nitric oxide reductase subunit B
MTATLTTPASNAVINPADESPLSAWWLRAIVIVMVIGFTVLIAITALAYRNAPPIPHVVDDPQGKPLFTDTDIGDGQAVFLKYGLMDSGSIRGHGAYLGPDYSAEALHSMGQDTAAALSQTQFNKQLAELDPMQRAGLQAEVALVLKVNRYDPLSGVLSLTSAEAQAWRQQTGYWTDYFKHPASNGGLKPNLIADPAELRQFTAFVTWAAWASVA